MRLQKKLSYEIYVLISLKILLKNEDIKKDTNFVKKRKERILHVLFINKCFKILS